MRLKASSLRCRAFSRAADSEDGSLVQYKWTHSGKWHSGRIRKIERIPGMKSELLIEKFERNVKCLRWDVVLNGIDRGMSRNFIDTQGESIYETRDEWVTQRWFSTDYVRDCQ